MKNRRAARLGLLGPALWAGVVLLTLGTVYPVKGADDPVKAEAQRLAAELRQAKDQLAELQAVNAKLRAAADEDIRRVLEEVKAKAEAEVERQKARSDEQAALAKKAQAEVERLNVELAKKTAENRVFEERLTELIDQVAAIKRQLGAPRGPKADEPPALPRVDPKPDEGPTPEQVKRLQDAFRRREEETRRAEAQGRDEAERDRRRADEAFQQAERARREAEEREKEARAAVPEAKVDPARLEAEIRAARLEAQLQVIKAAYDDQRQENARLRHELGERHAVDPKTQQRIDQLEAQVAKLSMVVEVLLKKIEMVRPER
jgi:chromosome segregation ATPase